MLRARKTREEPEPEIDSDEEIIDDDSDEDYVPEEEEEENVVKELPEDEFIRLTKKMFPKWANKDSNIANFMKELDPHKIYTKAEIDEYCLEKGINRLRQVMIYQGTTGHGFIIRMNKNGSYQLYPKLVKEFKKYF